MRNYKEHERHVEALEQRLTKTTTAIGRASHMANSIQYRSLTGYPTLTAVAEKDAASHANKNTSMRQRTSFAPPPNASDILNTIAGTLKTRTIPRLHQLENELRSHIEADMTVPLYMRRQRIQAGVSLPQIARAQEMPTSHSVYWNIETGRSLLVKKYVEAYERAGVPIDWEVVQKIRSRKQEEELVLGTLLRDERMYQGITLQEVADGLKIHYINLSLMEHGKRNMPERIRNRYARLMQLHISKRQKQENDQYFTQKHKKNVFAALLNQFEATHPYDGTLGDFYKRSRLRLGLSLETVANMAGRTVDTILNIEKGHGNVTSKMIEFYNTLFGITPPEELMKENEDRKKEIQARRAKKQWENRRKTKS